MELHARLMIPDLAANLYSFNERVRLQSVPKFVVHQIRLDLSSSLTARAIHQALRSQFVSRQAVYA